MTCCVPDAMAVVDNDPAAIENDDAALAALSRKLGDGTAQLEFAVPDAHCAACIRTIETALAAMPMVRSARVNLTRRRVRVVYDPAQPPSLLAPAIKASGYHTYVLDPGQESDGDPVMKELLRSLAVAGFAAANIMLFSVSVWSGATDATRDLFHWISAAIALPAVAYSGRIFFRSAWRGLRVGKTNMDVPITIGITLATALSLFETMNGGHHAYFDGVTMLLFFLLIGRALDHMMRERARNAITGLARLQPRGGTLVRDDGAREYIKLDEIQPGMLLEIKAGERVPVDSVLLSAGASFDYSIISGESLPHFIDTDDEIIAGAASLSGPLLVRTSRAATDSFLSRMAQMMDAAETAKTRPRRIADRASAVYAPIIHTIAFTTFVGWLLWSGGDWHTALMNAVAVLIITCPCALALAVPIVHVVAAGKLFERGVMMKDGAALERIAEIDSVAFDKTGTLTEGNPRLVDSHLATAEATDLAAALAASSTHPLSSAIARSLDRVPLLLDGVSEIPGKGVEARRDGQLWRLGSAAWCGVTSDAATGGVWLTRDGETMGHFTFEDSVRPEARQTIAALEAMHLPVRLLSGDAAPAVLAAASDAGIANARASLTPEDKLADVGAGRTLMVGDGINDAPALRAAYASMAPSSAADIGRSAADFVFTGNDLGAVPFVVATARGASRIVVQNLTIAIGYNAIAIPLAVGGYVTPLIAAIAMSASSIIVVANALRLRLFARRLIAEPQPRILSEKPA
ncbi:MAG: cadmium-translocating P-type ATPase [Hyphomicrobiales bacterium]|nr:MAG: cadmium-translocating P-type ATPase [Hyphomicrobiales bacterium]